MTPTAIAEAETRAAPDAAAEAAEYVRGLIKRAVPNDDTFIPSIEAPSTIVTSHNAADLIESTAELLDKAAGIVSRIDRTS